MSGLGSDIKFAFLGNHYTSHNGWNRKLCFEARDTFYACVDAQENGNKYRCPDELYAYEMWCPNDFRRVHSQLKRRAALDGELYDKESIDKLNKEKQTITTGRWVTKNL